MILREHDTARCSSCGSELWYGVKQEPTAWKVFYRCRPGSGCGDETIAGRIPVGDVESLDDVYERAEAMGQRL